MSSFITSTERNCLCHYTAPWWRLIRVPHKAPVTPFQEQVQRRSGERSLSHKRRRMLVTGFLKRPEQEVSCKREEGKALTSRCLWNSCNLTASTFRERLLPETGDSEATSDQGKSSFINFNTSLLRIREPAGAGRRIWWFLNTEKHAWSILFWLFHNIPP